MDRWNGKVAVVTGTTSGIGAAIAKLLVDEGLQVVGLGRRKQRGEELARELSGRKGKFHPLVVDIVNEEEVLGAFAWVKEHLGPVHILVNSAGILKATNLTNGNTQVWKDTININVLGLCVMTREAIKNMIENHVDGHIVHMNSLGGHYVYNYTDSNVYAASKYAVTALTETLRQELNAIGSKIKITSISPGFVKTEMLETLTSYDPIMPALDAEDVAQAVLYTLATPPHVQVHEMKLKSLR